MQPDIGNDAKSVPAMGVYVMVAGGPTTPGALVLTGVAVAD